MIRGGRSAIVAALGLALLAGCAAPTPTAYQRQNETRYGYAERRAEGDGWRVSFTANELTPREAVEGYALRRAAELMKERGVARFAVTDKVYEIRTDRTYAYPVGPNYDPRDFHRYAGSRYGDPFGGSQFITVESRTMRLEIAPGAPEGAIRVYETDAVLREATPAAR
jgi:hypothetical protein